MQIEYNETQLEQLKSDLSLIQGGSEHSVTFKLTGSDHEVEIACSKELWQEKYIQNDTTLSDFKSKVNERLRKWKGHEAPNVLEDETDETFDSNLYVDEHDFLATRDALKAMGYSSTGTYHTWCRENAKRQRTVESDNEYGR